MKGTRPPPSAPHGRYSSYFILSTPLNVGHFTFEGVHLDHRGRRGPHDNPSQRKAKPPASTVSGRITYPPLPSAPEGAGRVTGPGVGRLLTEERGRHPLTRSLRSPVYREAQSHCPVSATFKTEVLWAEAPREGWRSLLQKERKGLGSRGESGPEAEPVTPEKR